MSEKLIKPQVAPSVYNILERFKTIGLGEKDLIVLIQSETKLAQRDIKKTLNALKDLEKRLQIFGK